MRKIRRAVVHCSDSPDHLDIGVEEIRQWHLERGFADIGYHNCIRRDGTIEAGRDPSRIGAHVKGHNTDSLGVCLVGRRNFTPAQILSLIYLIQQWRKEYFIPVSQVLGHYELDAGKTCPNLDLQEVRKCLNSLG